MIATGSCKWTNAPLGAGEEDLLTHLEAYVPGAEPMTTATTAPPRHYFFSRSGFTPSMERLAQDEPDRIRLVGPDAIYASH